MNAPHTPELGQALFGQPAESFAVPEWVESMFEGILREVDRVYWNVEQEQFESSLSADFGAVHFRPYSWAEEVDAGPNFWLDSQPVRIRWYKHPGRGMSASHALSAEEWIAWHDAVMKELKAADDRNS
jgi:hypothetical protein